MLRKDTLIGLVQAYAYAGVIGSGPCAVEHVGARHVMLAGTHQREFDLVLDVFDTVPPSGRRRVSERTTVSVRCAAIRAPARTRRSGCLPPQAFVIAIEIFPAQSHHHRAIAADHLQGEQGRFRLSRLALESRSAGRTKISRTRRHGALHSRTERKWQAGKGGKCRKALPACRRVPNA